LIHLLVNDNISKLFHSANITINIYKRRENK
jgi:hypothetical protein